MGVAMSGRSAVGAVACSWVSPLEGCGTVRGRNATGASSQQGVRGGAKQWQSRKFRFGLRKGEYYLNSLTRAPLGGGAISSPPSGFLAISSKSIQVSPPNLQYPLSQQFYTLCENFEVQGIMVWPQMTSE